ncbi:hypothetical protein NP233_g4126 [Leucocoprinus birnbaumii]|uniref:Uncharacterized protein n=1 Tax=Leucocoprinus birnbaumii TaxID=56174 RepID=A0AAD5YVT6_9AGAR|nr:hypothetical protein NP233_g4126 [Leucocoprinus birnbaumii]
MSVSAGALIWISVRPLIRLAAGVASGYLITKADIFPLVAARGAGQVALNITLPCLLFSKIISAFTTDNIKAFGPLVLVAIIYEVLGTLLAWIIKQFFWVPHRFRYGILVAGGWGNVGDLSTAVLLSLTGSAPFRGPADQNLAVAYISVFMLVFIITLFPFGIHRLLAWDFVGPDVEDNVVQARIKARRRRVFCFWREENKEPPPEQRREASRTDEEKAFGPGPTTHVASPTSMISAPDDSTTVTGNAQETTKTSPPADPATSPTTETAFLVHYLRLGLLHARAFIKGLFNPVSIAIYVALPVSLVPQLKALFMEVPGVNMPSAPDGQPPLAFIQDIATFIGAASIPIGLICLGSSLARLNVPMSQWRTLPLGAITWMAVGKLIIIPVIGVLISKALVQSGVLFKDDKVLVFISMFFSCLPTATTQVYLTQVYTSRQVRSFLRPIDWHVVGPVSTCSSQLNHRSSGVLEIPIENSQQLNEPWRGMVDKTTEAPILLPITHLNYLSPENGRLYETTRNVELAFIGAAIWEVLGTIGTDCKILTGGIKFRPVLLCYLFSRLFALLFALLSVLEKSDTSVRCEALQITKSVFGCLAITSASFLFLRRVQAIWAAYPTIVHAFSFLWLVNVGVTALVSRIGEISRLANTGYCVVEEVDIVPGILPAIANLVFDTAVLIFVSYWVSVGYLITEGENPSIGFSWSTMFLGRALPKLSKVVLKGGQQYYLIVLAFNTILLTLMLIPRASPQLRVMFAAPTVVVTSAMACRVHRGLLTEGISTTVEAISLHFTQPTCDDHMSAQDTARISTSGHQSIQNSVV